MELTSWERKLLVKRLYNESIRHIAKEYHVEEQTIKNNLRIAYLKIGIENAPTDDREKRRYRLIQILRSIGTITEEEEAYIKANLMILKRKKSLTRLGNRAMVEG